MMGAKESADKALSDVAFSGNTMMLMYVCGGAALALAAWSYMAPKKSYASSLFQDGRPPDWDHEYKAAQVGQRLGEDAVCHLARA